MPRITLTKVAFASSRQRQRNWRNYAVSDRNVISGNLFAGIELFGTATLNLVYGNYIGLDATGTLDRGNDQEGIDLEFAGGNTIGGPLAGQRNIISGNGSDGIEIDGGDFNHCSEQLHRNRRKRCGRHSKRS